MRGCTLFNRRDRNRIYVIKLMYFSKLTNVTSGRMEIMEILKKKDLTAAMIKGLFTRTILISSKIFNIWWTLNGFQDVNCLWIALISTGWLERTSVTCEIPSCSFFLKKKISFHSRNVVLINIKLPTCFLNSYFPPRSPRRVNINCILLCY